MQKILFSLIRFSGIPWLLREVIYKRQIVILCFHNLSPHVADGCYQTLKSLYNIIPLKEYSDLLAGKSGEPLPEKALIITIDDGIKENYDLLSILKRENISITIFACSAIVGTHRHYWWKHVPEDVNSEELELMPNSLRLEKLAGYGFDENQEFEKRQALSLKEIQEMQEFVDFQSHTRFHPALPQCDQNRAEEEIGFSKQELEENIKRTVYAIAFPNGKYSDRDVEMVKQSGYQCSLTTDEGLNSLESDPFKLKRIDIPDNVDINELVVKASGAWSLLKYVLRKN